ncbi:hypothetical protein ERX46_02620 [Brumimicrobium glaciale]|jgi:hypothetical protein|uniref:Uncharacterized protein n=1 Tax=Brumimicrobium glaciale TaxID=200475 RepID=A0A4Q4KUV6_9FLAO|nr:hypothetical protein [Brumimicrobium glaciale]RYM35904.1 hypothetical protein ERX46_02620 [Brumimicrobium glaciale]
MKLETIYVIEDNKFGKAITEWAEDKRIQVVPANQKKDDLSEIVNGVVLFHENHNFTKDDDDMQTEMSRGNIPVHKVDINGTLAATNSNFNMWLDRNRPQSLLILGDEEIANNANLQNFLKGIEN